MVGRPLATDEVHEANERIRLPPGWHPDRGWGDLSTFLDVHQGVLPGEGGHAIEAVSAYLAKLGMPPAR